MKTVRSAPTSTRNSVGAHEPSAARTAALTTGRTMPSSPSTHCPEMSIDAFQFFTMDVTQEQTVVFGMRRPRLGQYFRGCFGHEQLLAGDTDAFATML